MIQLNLISIFIDLISCDAVLVKCPEKTKLCAVATHGHYTIRVLLHRVDAFSERQILKKNRQRCSLVRRGRSAHRGRTVRGLARGGGAPRSDADGPRHRAGRSATWCRGWRSLPDGRTVRALGPDGPRVRRGGGRSLAAPGSRSREGPRRGGEILGVV
jgi:hypothetical protein